jgi:hypothetical protein
MGDEPYAALLPWMVFAVVERGHGHGVTWAAVSAIITAVTLLATRRRPSTGVANLLMIGAVISFAVLAVAGQIQSSSEGIIERYGRTWSALSFVVLALLALALHTSVSEFYTRQHTRRSSWTTEAFSRVNVQITMIWSLVFTGIAASHACATWLDHARGYTTFHWVVPLALGAIGVQRTKEVWDDYTADELETLALDDPLLDLTLDWDPDGMRSKDR